MSQDLVAAITSAHADPAAMAERHQNQFETVDMRALDATSGTAVRGGGSIRTSQAEVLSATPEMNLQALAGQFSNGLKHGFYAKDIDRLMHKLEQSHQPGSGITFGDVTVELLNVQAKVGIADAFSKVSSKLSEGLQTMVVKQG